jgi:hypothetical protein
MADPATMMMAGAALGAATNRDDPLKGAMMGAALGGVGGGIASGALGGAGAAGVEAAGLTGAESALGSLARPDIAPVLSDFIPAEVAQGIFPVTPATMGEFNPAFSRIMNPASALETPMFDFDAIARASLGSDLPGASAVAGASPVQAGFNPMQALSAMNMLGGQQPQQPPVAGGGVRRGDPRLVQQDAIMSLLAPKRVEKRRISLL